MTDLQTVSDGKLTDEEIEFFVKHNASVRKRTAFEILEAAINYNNYSIFSNIEPIPIASLNVICECLFGVEYLDPNALYTVRDELSNNILIIYNNILKCYAICYLYNIFLHTALTKI